MNSHLPVADLDRKRPNILFRRPLCHFSGLHVETRPVPRASDLRAVERACGERPVAVRAELLERVNLPVDLRDGGDRVVDVEAERIAFGKVGFADRAVGDDRLARRSSAFTAVPADADAV